MPCRSICPSGARAKASRAISCRPDIYAEAFSAAVDFLGTQPFVDQERIGAIGICGSGSFVISAAKIDPRMKAIATVSMYDMGAANRNALKKSLTLEQRKEIIAEGSRAALRGVRGRRRPSTPAARCMN